MASKFILQQALSLAAPLTLLPLPPPLSLPVSSFFNVTLEVISGESRGEQGEQGERGYCGKSGRPTANSIRPLVVGFAFACYPENIISLDFYNGPKRRIAPSLSLSLAFSPCMRTLISFCFWAFCLLLFVSMSPSKLFCYLFCLTRFFTGCCLCLLGCSPHLRRPVKPLTLTHLRRHTPAHLPHTHTLAHHKHI